ncbi:MAG: folate family ECF transporter S component [Eubacteriales bacterium]
MKKKNFFKLRDLVTASLFIALSIVFTRMFSIKLSDTIRLSFGQTPIILAGILLGPIWGLLVGMLSDVTGFLLAPLGAYIPGLTLVAGLVGFIPGIYKKYLFKNHIELAIIVSVIVDMLIVNGLLATFFLSLVYSKRTFMAWFASRIWIEAIMVVVQSIVCTIIAKILIKNIFIENIQPLPEQTQN